MAVKVIPASQIPHVDLSKYHIVIYGETHVSLEDKELSKKIVREIHPDYSLFEALHNETPGSERVRNLLESYDAFKKKESRKEIYNRSILDFIHDLGISIDEQYLQYLGEAIIIAREKRAQKFSAQSSNKVLLNLKNLFANIHRPVARREYSKAVRRGIYAKTKILSYKIQHIYGSVSSEFFKRVGKEILQKPVKSIPLDEVGVIFGSLEGYVKDAKLKNKIRKVFTTYLFDVSMPDLKENEKAKYGVIAEAAKYGKVGGCDIEAERKKLSNVMQTLNERNKKMYETIKKYAEKGKVFALVGAKHAEYLAKVFRDRKDVLIILSEYKATEKEDRSYGVNYAFSPVIEDYNLSVMENLVNDAMARYREAQKFIVEKEK